MICLIHSYDDTQLHLETFLETPICLSVWQHEKHFILNYSSLPAANILCSLECRFLFQETSYVEFGARSTTTLEAIIARF